jgi:hypothetical protein
MFCSLPPGPFGRTLSEIHHLIVIKSSGSKYLNNSISILLKKGGEKGIREMLRTWFWLQEA